MFPKPRRGQFPLLVAVCGLLAILAAAIPIVTGQGGDGSITFDFTDYGDIPIVPRGEAGEWDSGLVQLGHVMLVDELFHIFYTGRDDDPASPSAIGYATSEDGLNWTKHADNPVLELGTMDLDETEVPLGIGWAVPLLEGDTWSLYLTPIMGPDFLSGSLILRATAPDPAGPWTVDANPALERGPEGAWDGDGIGAGSIVVAEDGYMLYYSAQGDSGLAIGLATSPDGMAWIKYDDPDTTALPFRDSDPVLAAGEPGTWDGGYVLGPAVIVGANGWEMLYYGGPGGEIDDARTLGLGYATGEDGVHWTRYGDAPFLTLYNGVFPWSPSVTLVNGDYFLYYTIFNLNADGADISMAVGTITYGAVEE